MNSNTFKGKSLEAKAREEYTATGWDVIGPAGLPDLICIKGQVIKFVECKAGASPVRSKQQKAHTILAKHGFVVEIYRERSKKSSKRKQAKYLPKFIEFEQWATSL